MSTEVIMHEGVTGIIGDHQPQQVGGKITEIKPMGTPPTLVREGCKMDPDQCPARVYVACLAANTSATRPDLCRHPVICGKMVRIENIILSS